LSPDPSEKAVVSLWIEQAFAWTMFVDGVEVKDIGYVAVLPWFNLRHFHR
jgi:hypothetical protein